MSKGRPSKDNIVKSFRLSKPIAEKLERVSKETSFTQTVLVEKALERFLDTVPKVL